MRLRQPRNSAVALVTGLTVMATVAMSITGTAWTAAAPPDPVVIVDDFEYAEGLPAGTDGDGVPVGYNTFAGAGSTITLANPGTPPAPALDAIPAPNSVLQVDVDVTSYAGVTHNFENAAVDKWVSQDWSDYAGLTLWLYGQESGSSLFIDVLENRKPGSTTDDAQRWTVAFEDDFAGWQQLELPFSDFTQKVVGNNAPADDFDRSEVHGWALGALGTGGARTYWVDDVGVYGVAPIAPLAATFTAGEYVVGEGSTADITVKLNRPLRDEDPAQVSVNFATEEGTTVIGRDYTPTSGTLTFVQGGPIELTFPFESFGDDKHTGDKRVVLRLSDPSTGLAPGFAMQAVARISDDEPYDPLLLDDFETEPYLWSASSGAVLTTEEIAAGSADALPGQGAYERVLRADAPGGTFVRDFATGQDWTSADGLSFWHRGNNTGDTIGVQVLDNRVPDPGRSAWSLAWSDEFDGPAGSPPDPSTWTHDLGDGTGNGNPGWGNDERQYYTDSTDNAATDGEGNMVITARAADGSQQCYYGTCEYTSARLLSANKAEFAYGRLEARIKLPSGEAGLWPAFWSLGTDIEQVDWPQTGEIDFMEYVSRIPDEVFGTIHGPGYAGGASYGDIINVENLSDDFHTFSIEWEPDLIEWYVDDILYHTATPADVAPNPWVFNDAVFLLLNMAIGGNFGGAVSPDLTLPQEMKIDYVRAFQGPDTAERFEAPFVDDFTGWQRVTVPFADFSRSDDQPSDAPDDGLGLDQVWGYGFRLPADSSPVTLDQVRLVDTTPPTVTITDSVPDQIAKGDVTFTFTFSEDVGTSFTTDDVTLTGGTKGRFSRVDATHATLVAKPPADADGTLEVAVAAGAFTDLAGNANTTAVTAAQAYATEPLPMGGFVITFDEPTPPVLTGFGGASGAVATDPTNASNKVAELTKGGPETWAGITVSTEAGLLVPPIPFSTSNSTMTLRLWSPTSGTPVLLKVENSNDSSQFAELQTTTTVAAGWETLTFDFAGLANPDLVYDKISIFPNFGTSGTGEIYYLDDITYPATTTPSPTPSVSASPTPSGTASASPTATMSPSATVQPTTEPTVMPGDLYQTAGYHVSGGREWFTTCEPYSATHRCRTVIWATQVTYNNGAFVKRTGWFLNNLTYLPAPRSLWVGNPLARTGTWTSKEGRQWRTECETATSGGNGCRSYIRSSVVQSTRQADGTWSYALKTPWVFNNIVRFS